MADKVKNIVFVYGTLKWGFGNHHLLEKAKFMGEYTTDKKYDMINLGAYPAVICGGKTAIKGELYLIDEEIEKRLDWLEGFPDHYKKTELNTPHGKAFMYIYPPSKNYEHVYSKDYVDSGEWK